MNQDKFSTMVKDGKDFIEIIQSVPEDKRPMLSAIAGTYIDGMIAQEQLTAQAEAERGSAAREGGEEKDGRGNCDRGQRKRNCRPCTGGTRAAKKGKI